MDEMSSLCERVSKCEEKIGDMSVKLERNDILTQQCVNSFDKLSTAMNAVQLAMQEITTVNKELAKDIGDVKNTVNSMNGRLSEVEENGKINFITWIKNNWVGFFIGIGSLIYLVSQWVK